jgi:hypothetical protein
MAEDRRLEQDEEAGAEQELLDRREFLIGLRKWSAAVIGGVVLGTLMAQEEARGAAGWINSRGGWVNGAAWANRGVGWVNGGAAWANRIGPGGAWVNGRGPGSGAWVNGRGYGGAGWVNR